MALDRDAILNTNDTPFQSLHVEEWGGSVNVRGLTGAEWDQCELEKEAVRRKPSAGHYAAHICVRGIVDDQGKNCFTVGDVQALMKRHVTVLQRIALKIIELSGATASAQVEIEKN